MKLGIDFGTCYSSAALFVNGNLKPVKEPLKSVYSFPSSVFITKDNQVIIGQGAENQRRLDPLRYCTQFKRNLGQNIPHTLGDRQLLPEELVGEILRGLKTSAEKLVDQVLDSVILTVPATYQSYKKGLMENAAKQAGFEDVILLEEPVAAAIYYTQNPNGINTLNDGEILLVYDLGGGTFDAALIQKQGQTWQSLTQPVGDSHCGGIDFDRLIYNDLISTLPEQTKQLLSPERRDAIALRTRLMIGQWCQEFKHQLTMVSEYEDVLMIGDLADHIYRLTQSKFEQMITPLVTKTSQLCEQLIEQANFKKEQIDRILLVGGSSRIPYIQRHLQQQFNQSKVVGVDEPELAICFGSALHGNWLENEGYKAYYQQAKDKLDSGDYQGAIVDLNCSLRLKPNNAESYLLRGEAYYKEGVQKAQSDYDKARSLNPNLEELEQLTNDGNYLSVSEDKSDLDDPFEDASSSEEPINNNDNELRLTTLLEEIEQLTNDGNYLSVSEDKSDLDDPFEDYSSSEKLINNNDNELKLKTLSENSLNISLKARLQGHSSCINSVAFSPDGQYLASGSSDETIKIWNFSQQKLAYTLTGHSDYVYSVAFSPDGKYLASGSAYETIKIWNLAQQKLAYTLTGHSRSVFSLAFVFSLTFVFRLTFSPDGKYLASGSADKTIKIWNLAQQKLAYTLTEHYGGVSSVAFSPDGKYLASGSADKTIKIWNLAQQKLAYTLTEHYEGVLSVAFSPDGKYLASCGWDWTIKIWNLHHS